MKNHILILLCLIVPTLCWNFVDWIQDLLLAHQELPFEVSLHRSYDDSFLCSGAIIEPNLVVTSSACMYYNWGGIIPPFMVSILVKNSIYYNATTITIPTDEENTQLAYIEIQENLNDIVSYDKKLPSGCFCTIDGYFPSMENDNEFIFKRIPVTVAECKEKGYVCAYNSIENLCEFDRGSALYCDISLIGILTMKEECNTTYETLLFEQLAPFCLNNAKKMLNDNVIWLIISIKYILRI